MTKPAAPYVALYPTDFLADIGHLGNTELGIYFRLLLIYYRDQRPLPFDTDRLRRLAMTFSPEEAKSLEQVMVEFFELATEPDGSRCWRHRRADQEIERANSRITNKRDAAAKARAVLAERKTLMTSALAKDQLDGLLDGMAGGQLPLGDDPQPPNNAKVRKVRTVPTCPQQQLIELYAKHLPMMPVPRKWDGTRAKNMRDRWAWVLTATREDGTRYATTTEEGLAQFDKFFRIAAASDFLTGRDGQWPACDLEWLMKDANFTKVIEGKYRNKEKA
ncbi:MAG: YdaU family protein [Burkholderiales bacterium]|nr:YdaU family protein [Burkholderiales bacterium]